MSFDEIIGIMTNGDPLPEVSQAASIVMGVAIIVAVVALILSLSPIGRAKGVFAIIECVITIISMIVVGITNEFWVVQLGNMLFLAALFATAIPQVWEVVITDDLDLSIRSKSGCVGFVAGLIVGYFMAALCPIWLFCLIWGIFTITSIVITIIAFKSY